MKENILDKLYTYIQTDYFLEIISIPLFDFAIFATSEEVVSLGNKR